MISAATSPEQLRKALRELQARLAELETRNEELHWTQVELEAARAHYFNFYDQAPVGYATISEKGLILECNLTTAARLGVARSSLLKKPIAQFISPEDQPLYDRHCKELFATGTPQHCDLRMRKKDGTGFWAELAATIMQGTGGARECRVVLSDLTERKQSEAALRESEQKFREIFNSTSEAIFIHHLETGRLVDVNDAVLRIYGYDSKEEVLRKTVGDLSANVPPYTFERAQELVRKTSREGPQVFEWLAKRRDGPQFWVEVSLSRSQNDGQGRILAVCRDISQRKREEAEKVKLEEQNRQLQRSESLGRMAGAIAHHFNNQLQAVMMSLELSMTKLAQNAPAIEGLTDALKSAGKAAEVSSLMLAYLGQTHGKREVVDLSEVCLRSLSLLQAVLPRNAVLATDLPSPGPAVLANANEIQQVLTNLITNACEASGDGRGSICVTNKTVFAKDIPALNRFPLGWQPQGSTYACLKISDTGCGIAAQDIEKLFDPFFSHKYAGRGMGLAVVLGIVRAHGGAIAVESEPGQGSVFRVFLPVAADAMPQRPEPRVQTPERGGHGTVLLVEDEMIVRKATSLALERLGFQVLEACDGEEAVTLFQKHQAQIRCMLSDLSMPRKDGWETLTAVRQLAPGLPVVLASGYDEAKVMAGDHPELPQAFLTKPYTLAALREALARALAVE